MQNANTVYVLMRCERGWPEEQYPQVVVVAFSVDKIYNYVERNIPDAEKEPDDDGYEQWHGDYFDYWIEEHTPLD